MKNLRKDNKGFSLVELIVVVLIMAIIAVALAPQVMKWVNNSRESADANNYDSLYANVQLALTDKAAYKEVSEQTADIVITTDEDDTSITGTDKDDFEKALTALDSGWNKIQKKVSGGSGDYTITIKCTGTTSAPKAPEIKKSNPPTLSSDDLK